MTSHHIKCLDRKHEGVCGVKISSPLIPNGVAFRQGWSSMGEPQWHCWDKDDIRKGAMRAPESEVDMFKVTS